MNKIKELDHRQLFTLYKINELVIGYNEIMKILEGVNYNEMKRFDEFDKKIRKRLNSK